MGGAFGVELPTPPPSEFEVLAFVGVTSWDDVVGRLFLRTVFGTAARCAFGAVRFGRRGGRFAF